MALADRTRQSGDAATRWPITILLSNGSNTEPLENKTVIGYRVAALPLCRVLSARAINLNCTFSPLFHSRPSSLLTLSFSHLSLTLLLPLPLSFALSFTSPLTSIIHSALTRISHLYFTPPEIEVLFEISNIYLIQVIYSM